MARVSTTMFGLYILVVSIIDFGHVEWQFFSKMSGRPICTAPGVPRPVGGRPPEHLARSRWVELLRLSRPQSVYRTDLSHTDVRLRPAVPAEHVDQFHPQTLEVA